MVMTLKEAYLYCIKNAGKTDGKILFEALTERSLSDVLTYPEDKTDTDFDSSIKRLKNGEPLQYILGKTEFMGLCLKVNPSVLIPRQDTELLTEWATDKLKDIKNARVLDICTGSGCIAISVQKYTGAEVFALDISEDALKTAEENNSLNSTNVSFFKADAHTFSDLTELDMVLSNPPYIETEVVLNLDSKVKDFEPHLALDGGENGLDFYENIAKNSKKMLKNGGFLAVEIGYNQGSAVSEIFDDVFGNSQILKDLCGLDRVVYSCK